MTPTVAVIPSRYEPDRLAALLDVVAPDVDQVLVMDTGHEPPFTSPHVNVRVVPTTRGSIYHWWNEGWRLAAVQDPVNVAVLNDDIRLLPGTLPLLARALRETDGIGAVYPDPRCRTDRVALPRDITLAIDRNPAGPRELTGYCFMFRGELPIPPFDEGYEWWYGDSQFDESVRLAGYGVARVDGVPIDHKSDAETNDWARRPELKDAVERDGIRWAKLHQEVRDGRWWPIAAVVSA